MCYLTTTCVAFGLGTGKRGDSALRGRRRRGRDEPADGAVLAERRLGPEASDGPTLKVEIDTAGIDFACSADGEAFITLLEDADARVLTTTVASGFVGAVVGPYIHRPDSHQQFPGRRKGPARLTLSTDGHLDDVRRSETFWWWICRLDPPQSWPWRAL